MVGFSRQHVYLATGTPDTNGQLIYADGQLVAVLVQLEGWSHGDLRGRWHLKAAFGSCSDGGPGLFDNLEHAEDWIYKRLTFKPPEAA